MKQLQTTLMYLFIATAVAFTSCDGEDGMDGMDGAQGEQGIPGQDGQDGAANLTSLLFDATGFNGNFTDIEIPEITEEALVSDVFLSYLTDDGVNWVAIPTPFDNYQFNFSVHTVYAPGVLTLDYGDAAGNNLEITAGDLQELRVVIIEGSSAGRSAQSASKEDILQDLRAAGVDINNYNEVASYFHLN